MKPKEVLEKWIALFNDGDVENIAELYHKDAVNHQVTFDPIKGKNAIKEMFASEFSKFSMICIPENIFEDGEWA